MKENIKSSLPLSTNLGIFYFNYKRIIYPSSRMRNIAGGPHPPKRPDTRGPTTKIRHASIMVPVCIFLFSGKFVFLLVNEKLKARARNLEGQPKIAKAHWHKPVAIYIFTYRTHSPHTCTIITTLHTHTHTQWEVKVSQYSNKEEGIVFGPSFD